MSIERFHPLSRLARILRSRHLISGWRLSSELAAQRGAAADAHFDRIPATLEAESVADVYTLPGMAVMG